MNNKNSKSDGYIVREAENIIENYLRDREICDINNYYNLKQKYKRLRIVTVAMFITFFVGILLNIIIK